MQRHFYMRARHIARIQPCTTSSFLPKAGRPTQAPTHTMPCPIQIATLNPKGGSTIESAFMIIGSCSAVTINDWNARDRMQAPQSIACRMEMGAKGNVLWVLFNFNLVASHAPTLQPVIAIPFQKQPNSPSNNVIHQLPVSTVAHC